MLESAVTLPSSALTDIELMKQAMADMKTSQARQHEETRAQIAALGEQMRPIADLARDMALSRQEQGQQDAAIARCFGEVAGVRSELHTHIQHTKKTEQTMWRWQGGIAALSVVIVIMLSLLAWYARDFIDQTRQRQALLRQDFSTLREQHESDFRAMDHRLDIVEPAKIAR